MTAARAPFLIALDQLGGFGTAGPPFFFVRVRACAFASDRLRARPRAGRVSIRPPWVPRCLRRRFFFVWAIALNLAENVLDHVTHWIEVADRWLVGISLDGGLWNEADELGLDRPRAVLCREPRDLRDDLRQGHRAGVVDVHRDLRALALARQPEGADSRQPTARLAHLRGDLAGDLGVRRVELDVEGDERLAGRDQGGARARMWFLRSKIGPELPRAHATRELRRPTLAEVGTFVSFRGARHLAIEED